MLSLVLAGALMMGAAPNVKSYKDTLQLDAKGSAQVSAVLELQGVSAGTLEIPLTIGKGMDKVEFQGLPANVKVEPQLKSDTPSAKLTFPAGTPAEVKFTMNYTLPKPKAKEGTTKKSAVGAKDEQTLTYRFLNNTSVPVTGYTMKILLPDGKLVHSVVEKMPKGKGADAAVVNYITENGRSGLAVSGKNLKFGDVISVKFIAVPEKKSYVALIFLGIAAVLYLISFKDIVKTPDK